MYEKQMNEAMARIKALGMHGNVARDYKGGVLNMSERGILYWVEDPTWLERIHDFEQRYDAVVYHVIHNYTEFGEMLSCLYVSCAEEEWELDRQDLQYDEAYAYVINLDAPELSEVGRIGIKPMWGGVVRVA